MMGVVLLGALAFAGAEATSPGGVRPHGEAESCTTCHTDDSGALVQPVVPLCQSCHTDAHMHPVAITPQSTRVPAGWPLESGQVTCATCHIEPAHTPDTAVPAPYHRGGPYADRQDLCYQCHARTDFQRDNPHHDTEEQACTACHVGRPASGASPDASRLRQSGSAVCQGCHPVAPHAGAIPHLGQPLPPGSSLPSDHGSIACWTCHDVHRIERQPTRSPHALTDALRTAARASEWSTLPTGTVIWPGESTTEPPTMLALPLQGAALCRDCHGDGP
jgi:hypothetical protein